MKDLSSDSKTALLVIDQQIDFEPGGALAVAGGDEIVEGISQAMREFQTVVVTQDSHPKGHISFASSYEGKKAFDILNLQELEADLVKSNFTREKLFSYLSKVKGGQQILWPDHCVVGTQGWQLDHRLPLDRADLILRKGTRIDCDSYSAFRENDGSPTGLQAYLKSRGIHRVVVVGLAGDYCVFWSAEDAIRDGFSVVYPESLTRFVGFPKNSRENALNQLRHLGVELRS